MKEKPALANEEPFKTVLSGDREAIAKFTMGDLVKIAAATLFGMDVETYATTSKTWLEQPPGPALEASLYRTHLPAAASSS